MPVMKDRYDGNSGNTQGDRKENSPAENATRTPSDSPIVAVYRRSDWKSALGVRSVPLARTVGEEGAVAAPVDDERRRDAPHAVKTRHRGLGIEAHGKAELVLLQIRRDHGGAAAVLGDRQHDEPLVLEPPVKALHARHLLLARLAPGRPEVEEDHLALELGQRQSPLVGRVDAEWLGRLRPAWAWSGRAPPPDPERPAHRPTAGAESCPARALRSGTARLTRAVYNAPSEAAIDRRPVCAPDVIGSRHSIMLATLIADDLTGACDAGAPFAGRGPRGCLRRSRFAWPGVDRGRGRHREPWAPAGRCRGRRARGRRGVSARVSTGGLLFKKIDSTLRGPIGAELEALLETSGRRAALVCPAFPGQGRTVADGMLLVNGAPAHESPIGRDPAYPGPTSDVVEIVRRGAARPVSLLPLDRVRGDRDALARTLRDARDRIIVADALTDGDLDALARATLGCTELALAGSAGLARAVAAAHGLARPRPRPLPRGTRVADRHRQPASGERALSSAASRRRA